VTKYCLLLNGDLLAYTAVWTGAAVALTTVTHACGASLACRRYSQTPGCWTKRSCTTTCIPGWGKVCLQPQVCFFEFSLVSFNCLVYI
jgi:hypothetical protein